MTSLQVDLITNNEFAEANLNSVAPAQSISSRSTTELRQMRYAHWRINGARTWAFL